MGKQYYCASCIAEWEEGELLIDHEDGRLYCPVCESAITVEEVDDGELS